MRSTHQQFSSRPCAARRSERRAKRHFWSRRAAWETLEPRTLLSADPWQNPRNALDVTNDGRTTAADVLAVIDALNMHGSQVLSTPTGLTRGTSPLLPPNGSVLNAGYVDVNGDGRISPLDALVIINRLNGEENLLRVRLEARDLADNPITTIPVGGDFKLAALVKDLRAGDAATGVFDAYVDVTYDNLLATIAANAPVTFGVDYTTGRLKDTTTPGLVRNTGAGASFNRLGPSERLLWTVPVHAAAAGLVNFVASGGNPANPNEFTLFDVGTAISPDNVDFVNTSVQITSTLNISISDVTQVEGNLGQSNFVFTVTVNASHPDPVTVNFATAPGSAQAGADYVDTTGALTFAANETTKTVTVQVNGDVAPEGNETFFVNLSNPLGAVLLDAQGVGTILDDDGAPNITINDISISEGDVGTTDGVFTVTLSSPSVTQITVGFATADDTALAGVDYTAATGAVTFNPGETQKFITIRVIGDTVDEPNETLRVNLSSPVGATLQDAQGVGTIIDNDNAPTVSIDDAAVVEGNLGTTALAVTISLSSPSAQTVRVAYATANGTAVSGLDYIAQSGTVTFLPGISSQQVTINVLGDTIDEDNETFNVNLTSAVNATIFDASATLTIVDDDALPSLSVANATVNEGNSGQTDAVFVVTLAPASGRTVVVNYATATNTATAGVDYVEASGVLTFTPAVTSQRITVKVNGDLLSEPDEFFFLNLTNPVNAAIGSGQAIGTIVNDDAAPSLSISDVALAEGNSGTTNFVFDVTLSSPIGAVATVVYGTANGTAVAPNDYITQSSTLTFAAGETAKKVTISVIGDLIDEANEQFFVNLTSASGAPVSKGQGVGTILNDDGGLSVVSISDAPPVAEGNSGTNNVAVFTVTLSPTATQPVTVRYTTLDGTATAPDDYLSASNTLTFQPGESRKTISVSVVGDTIIEGVETFLVQLSGASNAQLGIDQATGSILDDDGAAELSINDVAVNEGNVGSIDAVFTIMLSSAVAQQVSVGFATADNTATAGQDYLASSGIVTFAPGEVQKRVTVKVFGDTVAEGDESFFVNLSSPAGALIRDAQGVGTIRDDDVDGIIVSDVSVVEGNAGQTDAVFRIDLTKAFLTPVTVAFATSDRSAQAGEDYFASSGTVTFAPGVTSQSVTVKVMGDTKIEIDETFAIDLTDGVGAPIVDPQGIGRIFNDDPTLAKQVRIRLEATDTAGNPVSFIDVNSNFLLKVYVQDLRPDVANQVRGVFSAYLDLLYDSQLVSITGPLQFSSTYGNGQNGDTLVPGTIDEAGAFDGFDPLGVAERLFLTVPMRGVSAGKATFITDPADNPDNEVALYSRDELPTAVDPPLVDYGQATLQIGTNFLSVDAVTLAEGDAGTKDFVFVVRRNIADPTTATVRYTTTDGGAKSSDNDYTPTSGTLTFTPGNDVQLVTVKVNGDLRNEANETFFLHLSDATNVVSGADGVATIENDDAPPTVSVANASASEGSPVVFKVTLSFASGQDIPVTFNTAQAAGSTAATANVDYQPVSGTLVIPAGATEASITVQTIGDITDEPDETFVLNIGSSIAPLGQAQAIGTIREAVPLQISGFVYLDLDNNGVKAPFELGIPNVIVTLTSASGATQSLITDQNGAYAFLVPPGTYSVTEVHPGYYVDGLDTAPAGITVDQVKNDAFIGVHLVADNPVRNLNFGERALRPEFALLFANRCAFFASELFTDRRFGPTVLGPNSEVNLNLAAGTKVIAFDGGWSGMRAIQAFYDSDNGSVKLELLDNNLKVLATGQEIVDGSPAQQIFYSGTAGRTYFLRISGTNPFVALRVKETVAVGDINVVEPDTGTRDAVFRVRLSNPAATNVVVGYTVSDGTASSTPVGTSTTPDYNRPADVGLVTFAPGEIEKTITVQVVGDTLDEADETFTLNLTSASNAVIFRGQGKATINDNDAPPSLSVSDVVANEGDAGLTNFVFTVSLDQASDKTVSVVYKTADGSAVAGLDYLAATGTLTFAPGVTSQNVTVQVKGDTRFEGFDTFFLNLSAPTDSQIAKGQGVGTIANDDVAPLAPSNTLAATDLAILGTSDFLRGV